MALFVSLSPHLEVLNTLQQCMSLFLSVLPLVSSRVLSTHPNQKRHPALEDMQKNCKRMLLLRRENAGLLEGQVSTFTALISFRNIFSVLNFTIFENSSLASERS